MTRLKDSFVFIGVLVAGIFCAVLLVTALWLVSSPVLAWHCAELGRTTGWPTRYALAVGCLVQRDGAWVPYETLRDVTVREPGRD